VSSYLSLHKTDTCSTGTRDIYANEDEKKEDDDDDENEDDEDVDVLSYRSCIQ